MTKSKGIRPHTVRWTTTELNTLAKEAERLAEEGTLQGMDLLDAVRTAQRALPENRRRKIISKHVITPKLAGILPALIQAGQSRYLANVARNVSSQATLGSILRSSINNTEPTAPPVNEVPPPPPPPPPAQKPIVELLSELVALILQQPKVIEAAKELGRAAIESTIEQAREAVPHGKHSPYPTQERQRTRLPKVLLLGFKPDQRAPFERRYANKLAIRWWYDESMSLLQEKAKTADMVLANAAISHSASDHVMSAGKSLKRVLGGTQSMFEELDKLLEQLPH